MIPWFLVSFSTNFLIWLKLLMKILNMQLVSKILTFTSSMTRYNSVGMSISSIKSTILGCLTRLKIDTSFWIMCSCHTKVIFNDYGLVGKNFTVEKAERIGICMDSSGFFKKVTDVASSNMEGTRGGATSVLTERRTESRTQKINGGKDMFLMQRKMKFGSF